MKTKSKIEEKKLTKAELETREKVIKDLKKNKSSLVKRYGKDAEAVMYGRATNIAKKMAESENKNKIKELVRKALMQEMDAEAGADKYEGEQKLSQASAMLSALESKLKSHNWFHYQTDGRVYDEGMAQKKEIQDIVKNLQDMGYGDDAKELYNKYAPYEDGGVNLRLKEENIGLADIGEMGYTAGEAAFEKIKGRFRNKPDHKAYREGFFQGFTDNASSYGLNEDLDLGHEDNEPHMLKADLYRIGKYAMELYQMVDEFEGKGEVDFPHWWQSKIINAKSNLVGAKHYLDFEIKEPAIDAMVGVASDEEPMMENIGKDEILSGELYKLKGKIQDAFFDKIRKFINMGSYEDAEYLLNRVKGQMKEKSLSKVAEIKEDNIGKDEILAGKIMKALKDIANKDASDQHNLKQARIALNKGNMDAAKKIAKPYIAEKLAKQLKSK